MTQVRPQGAPPTITLCVVCGNGSGQIVPAQIMMFIRPFRGVGNLIRVGGRGKDLGEQWIRIKCNSTDQFVEFGGWIRGRCLGPDEPGGPARDQDQRQHDANRLPGLR